VLVELQACNKEILNDVAKVEEIMVLAAKKAKATILQVYFHKFEPHGVTGVVTLAESHISIHSWPELGYAAVDVFTCGKTMQPQVAVSYLIKKFKCKNPLITEVKRGIIGNGKANRKPSKN
jgi:S-adenosylmethionine decarboxylase